MKLTESNPYLADPGTRRKSLLVSVLTSSAIEGIHLKTGDIDLCKIIEEATGK